VKPDRQIMDHYNGITYYYLDVKRHGVAFLIKDSLKKYLKNIVAYSKRIIILQAGTLININLIQIYAPKANKAG
jgi:exonuclease III